MMRFLKPTLIMLALLAGTISRADTFVFNKEGLAIDTPVGWAVLKASAGAEFLDETNVKQELKEMARDAADTSLLSIIRENPPIGVSPGIHLNYWPGHLPSIRSGMDNVIASLRQNVPKFSLVTAMTRAALGDFDAAYISYQYEIVVEGTSLQILEKFWLVPMGDHYLTVSTGVEPNEGQAARNAIEKSVQSLRRFP